MLDIIDSTNNYLKRLECDGDETIVVTAEYQQAGRGQVGNHWEAAAGKNLLFSLMLRPRTVAAAQMFVLSEAISLSIVEALPAVPQWGGALIKWPNDIYYKDRKVAGILIENTLVGTTVARSVVGCGININQEVFCSDAPNPISLRQMTGVEVSRTEILEDILQRFIARCERLEQGSEAERKCEMQMLHRCYLDRLYRREGMHPYRDAEGPFVARIHDVEPDGHLILEDTEGKCRRYAFKEVEYCL